MDLVNKIKSIDNAEEFSEVASYLFMNEAEEEFDNSKAMDAVPITLSKGRELRQPDATACTLNVLIGIQSREVGSVSLTDDQILEIDSVLVDGYPPDEFPCSNSLLPFCLTCAGLYLPSSRLDYEQAPSDTARTKAYQWIDRAVEYCLTLEKREAKAGFRELIGAVSGKSLGLNLEDKEKGLTIIARTGEVFGKPFASSLKKSCKHCFEPDG